MNDSIFNVDEVGFSNKTNKVGDTVLHEVVTLSKICLTASAFSTSDSGSRKDHPPLSKKPSMSSVMVFITFAQFRDWMPSE